MRRWTSFLALAVVVAPGAGAAEVTEHRVSFEARGEVLRSALEKLTAGTNTRITVDARVPDVPVRLLVRGVSIDHALRLIVRQASKDVPLLTYEADPEGFRLYLEQANGGTPAEPESPDRVTFTARKAAAPRTEPATSPAPPAAPGSVAAETLPIGAQPPRINPTLPQYRLTYIPGTQVYIPPPSPPRRSRDPLDTHLGRGAYKIDGVAKIVGYGIPWRKTEYHLRTRAPLEGRPGGGSGGRRRRDTGKGGGGGAGGDNDRSGGGGDGGGFGRRPL